MKKLQYHNFISSLIPFYKQHVCALFVQSEGRPFLCLIVATCNKHNGCFQEFEVEDNINEDEGLRMRSKIKRENLRMVMMGIGKRGKYHFVRKQEGSCSNSVFILCLESMNVFHLMHILFCKF